jgi:hypothetical protein
VLKLHATKLPPENTCTTRQRRACLLALPNMAPQYQQFSDQHGVQDQQSDDKERPNVKKIQAVLAAVKLLSTANTGATAPHNTSTLVSKLHRPDAGWLHRGAGTKLRKSPLCSLLLALTRQELKHSRGRFCCFS